MVKIIAPRRSRMAFDIAICLSVLSLVSCGPASRIDEAAAPVSQSKEADASLVEVAESGPSQSNPPAAAADDELSFLEDSEELTLPDELEGLGPVVEVPFATPPAEAVELSFEDVSPPAVEAPTPATQRELKPPEMAFANGPQQEIEFVDLEPRQKSDELTIFLGAIGGSGSPLTKWQPRKRLHREVLLERYGMTKESEQAVNRGLDWLARHQLADGSWSFDHTAHPDCDASCTHPGTLVEERFAATGLALLPFLGDGNTHQVGKYASTVRRGLNFLGRQADSRNSYDFRKDSELLICHGLAAIAICESYGMSEDVKLHQLAQGVIRVIGEQERPAGGWQRNGRADALTSAVMLEANLAAGRSYAGGWRLEDTTERFFESSRQSVDPLVQAPGLFAALNLARPNDYQSLLDDFEQNNALADAPFWSIMPFAYYASRAMFEYGGADTWKQWNQRVQAPLIEAQTKQGHAAGSWYVTGDGDPGNRQFGRLYKTAYAVLILQTCHRYPCRAEIAAYWKNR